MKITLASIFLLSSSSAMAYDGEGHHGHGGDHHAHPYQDRPYSHVAYHHVEQACAKDVEFFCTAPTTAHPLLSQLEWAFPSEIELMEISHAMDLMMDSFFTMAPPSEHHHTIAIYAPDTQHQSPKRVTLHDLNFVADSTASQLASQTEPEHIPALAEQLNDYGKHLMASSKEGKPDHHIGRRLTEMDATTLGPHVRLPFGCHKNACLMNALPLVSPECDRSLKELQSISALEYQMEETREEQSLYMLLHFSLFLIFMALVIKKARKDLRLTRMGQQILESIYANPKLKQQVEREMGQSVGNQAPIPGSGKDCKEHADGFRRIRLYFSAALFYTFLFSPNMIVPVCVMAMFAHVIHMCVIVHKPDEDEEEDEEVEEDDLAKPLMQGKGQKHTFQSEKVVVDGVSVQIV